MVPMRDGVRLATDIYRPSREGVAKSGRFPTILVRTPYIRSHRAEGADQFVSRGYVLLVQSVRGRYGSEGHWRFFQDDPADGYGTSVWIASQPWSDGAIGTTGGS
jgi:putative CocE/NonD family hydrolase